ncbi:hypothetical protein ACJMK2_024979 [Sinanodonta woodiana]|uniref:Uncharacterized protein n=1 Tax=Sinanodonta woodiana TaxID=1069815 RepID=A0ABD3XGL9_SINWO
MALEDTIRQLEVVITQFEEKKLEPTRHLTKAKDCLEKKKLEKYMEGGRVVIRKRGRNLTDWETIRYQMGPQGKPALRQRVNDFTESKQMEFTEDAKAEINGIPQNHLVASVRRVSSGAAALYEWIRHYIPVEEHN